MNGKVYVEVTSVTSPEGLMLPRALMWEDGRLYKIDRVSEIKQAASMKCGGQGDRYTIWIGGKMSYLYFERSAAISGNIIGRWFVEKKAV